MSEIKTITEIESDYSKYRGKCKEFVDKLVSENTDLQPVCGWYVCPFEGKREHWWAVDKNGVIVDPSVRQFLSKGVGGEYIEYAGKLNCDECDKEIDMENEYSVTEGFYTFCSDKHLLRFVGL